MHLPPMHLPSKEGLWQCSNGQSVNIHSGEPMKNDKSSLKDGQSIKKDVIDLW